MIYYLLSFLIGIFATLLMLPMLRVIAFRIGMVSNENARSSHIGTVPNVGGMVMFIYAVANILFWSLHTELQFSEMIRVNMSFICVAVMAVVGMIDDVRDIPAFVKLVIEIVVCSAYMIVVSRSVHLSMAVGVLIMLTIINAYNLIDGIDGLALGILLTLSLSCAVCLSASVLGSMLGVAIVLLIFNMFQDRWKVFLGDGGTLSIGFLLAVGLLKMDFVVDDSCGFAEWTMKYVDVSFKVLCCLSLPVIDMVRVALMRIINHESPFKADRRHLHHILIDKGLPHWKATLLIVMANAIPIVIYDIYCT